jgi:hypothetical protein
MIKSEEYYANLSLLGAYDRARKLITCFAIYLVDNNTDRLNSIRLKYLELLENSKLQSEYGLTQDITKHLHLHMLSNDILSKIS